MRHPIPRPLVRPPSPPVPATLPRRRAVRVVVLDAVSAPATRTAPPNKRRSAGIALGVAFALLAAFTVALTATVETVKPEWRDPEYGHRLKRIQKWQTECPERPPVLVFGSSRAQMGVSPTAMEFPAKPGAPLVYNFGYRGATPLVSWLLLARALDEGVRPRAVLLVVALDEIHVGSTAEELYQTWGSRLSATDLDRLAPYTIDGSVLRRNLRGARLAPGAAHWEALVSDLLPTLQDAAVQFEHRSWEKMDDYGFVPFPIERFSEAKRGPLVTRARTQSAVANRADIGPVSDRAIRDAVTRCRAEGIAVGIVWAPESPWFRALYTPAARASAAAYTRALKNEVGVAVFPAPEHLEELDFVDGYHLTPDGAAKYSRWLADVYLRPWLAEVPK